jgi:hypothetical protein
MRCSLSHMADTRGTHEKAARVEWGSLPIQGVVIRAQNSVNRMLIFLKEMGNRREFHTSHCIIWQVHRAGT